MDDHDTQSDVNNADSVPADASTGSKGGALSGPLGIVLSIALLGTAGFFAYRTFYAAEPVKADSPPVMCICSETGKTFKFKFRSGDAFPVMSPHSKKNTGYQAEACYWQKGSDKPKAEPTWVLLNEYAGKDGVTECPDCGRVVTHHNEQPPGQGRGSSSGRDESLNDDAASADQNTGRSD